MSAPRDHGGGIDAAAVKYGGARTDWLDLSTGINPVPYPVGGLSPKVWTELPDVGATERFHSAARAFWSIPDGVGVLAAPGASALIARLPQVLGNTGRAFIAPPTYNEWEAAFRLSGWTAAHSLQGADAAIHVHPNNPDGALAPDANMMPTRYAIYDESFADAVQAPISQVPATSDPRVVVLKSFGKFWGLAGVRLGVLIGASELLERMAEALGPWPVSGPALALGARALSNTEWVTSTRDRLVQDSARLDMLLRPYCDTPQGTTLFRLYAFEEAQAVHTHLAKARVWTRVFPYNPHWIRLGLPGSEANWARLEAALESF